MQKENYKIEIFKPGEEPQAVLPFIEEGISAGFPSPAADYIDQSLNLNEVLIRNKASTFFGRVRGDSLYDDDIRDGDILVIDKSLEPQQGDLVVACIDGEFTLKYVDMRENDIWLLPANEHYKPIHITEDNDFLIWGIVTYSIKKHRDKRRK